MTAGSVFFVVLGDKRQAVLTTVVVAEFLADTFTILQIDTVRRLFGRIIGSYKVTGVVYPRFGVFDFEGGRPWTPQRSRGHGQRPEVRQRMLSTCHVSSTPEVHYYLLTLVCR